MHYCFLDMVDLTKASGNIIHMAKKKDINQDSYPEPNITCNLGKSETRRLWYNV